MEIFFLRTDLYWSSWVLYGTKDLIQGLGDPKQYSNIVLLLALGFLF